MREKRTPTVFNVIYIALVKMFHRFELREPAEVSRISEEAIGEKE
jgi:hypothetical protein